MRPYRMKSLPANFAEFVDEIAGGVGGLYGPAAAEAYRSIAEPALEAAVEHPMTEAIGVADDGSSTAGFVLAILKHGVGQISFIHVLRRYAGRGVEQQLIAECARVLRATGVDGIVSECIPFCALDVADLYRSEGFEHVPRALMSAPLGAPELRREGAESRPLAPRDYDEAARVIAEAYRDHPGRILHAEVCSEANAGEFVQYVADGEYGVFAPMYMRGIDHDGALAGVILGCQVAPDYGFVLQVAVRPEYQNQRLGQQLLRALATAFREAGLGRIALGVTLASPAVRLYQRLGFTTVRDIDAYVWAAR